MAKKTRREGNSLTGSVRYGKVYGLLQQDLCSRSRQRRIMEARVVPAFLVRESGGIALTELSNELIFDLSALSKAAGRLESIMKTDIRLVDRVESIREEVSLKRICDK